MKHHPDRGGDPAQFQRIQEAYDTLGDTAKRQQYDNPAPHGHSFRDSNGFSFQFGPDFNDIFAQFGFGDPFAQHRQQRKNKDLRIQIELDLPSTLKDQTKTISVQTTTGTRETVQVNIPRGIRSGNQMRYPGLGDNMFNTIPRGDLYVHFHVQDDPQFQIEGDDVVYHVVINAFDAMTGTTIDVPGLSGSVFRLQIPPGTGHTTRMRLPNQGLYQLNTTVRGNLICEIFVDIPKITSPEGQELIRQLKTTL